MAAPQVPPRQLKTGPESYTAAGGGGGGGGTLTITEIDGSPSVAATSLVLPNGTLSVVGTVATYTPAASSANSPHVVNGRLTAVSGIPIPATDQIGISTLYWTPFQGNLVTLWDGAAWTLTPFVETALALGTMVNSICYDVFAYLSAGTLTLEKLAWKNTTVTITIASPGVISWVGHGMLTGDPVVFTTTGTLPTGIVANTRYFVVNPTANDFQLATFVGAAVPINTSGTQSGVHTAYQARQRNTDVTLQDGRYCKSGDKTRLYLGTFFTTSTTTTEDSARGTASSVGGNRFLWNYYNRVARQLTVIETTPTWTYATNAWRQGRFIDGNRVDMVVGISEEPVEATLLTFIEFTSPAAQIANFGIGLDQVTIPSLFTTGGYSDTAASGNDTSFTTPFRGQVGIGYHFLAWMEYGATSCTFLGRSARRQSGMTAYVRA